MTTFWWKFLALCLLCGQVQAQSPDKPDLVAALQQGGHVIVLRHTSSPRNLPDAASANADNVNGERQLDANGRQDAEAFGAALRRLGIVVTSVQSSPAYRAQETARHAGLTGFTLREELGNEGMGDAGATNAEWLRAQLEQAPDSGNMLLITHGPNINAAFPDHASGLGEGDALVFRGGNPEPVARVGIDEWPAL